MSSEKWNGKHHSCHQVSGTGHKEQQNMQLIFRAYLGLLGAKPHTGWQNNFQRNIIHHNFCKQPRHMSGGGNAGGGRASTSVAPDWAPQSQRVRPKWNLFFAVGYLVPVQASVGPVCFGAGILGSSDHFTREPMPTRWCWIYNLQRFRRRAWHVA